MKIERALVVGCGSIGRRHIANLRRLGVRDILAHDPDPDRAAFARSELRCRAARSLADGLDAAPQVALVCTPPAAHADAAAAALSRGIACFIEKPVSHDVASASALARRFHGRPAVVGYQLRRHPGVLWLKSQVSRKGWGRLLHLRAQVGQYLPDWRPWQDYRKSYTARRALGGGILLDASHEIDLAMFLAGPIRSVYCAAKRLSRLDIDVEDTAELVVEFASGAMGSVHLDMIRRAADRSCEVSCENGTARWSYPDALGRAYDARSKAWTVKRFSRDANAMYLDELRLFLAAARGEDRDGLATLGDGLAALKVIEAAKRSAKSGKREAVR
ncbi:MAG: Gfo/Idh/MocA family oxidoreductase [Elusimicrobia bacterium]|nr:Gfo/Idh/MocA family oxidoreductase [Elusimicrobiota bacterium]